MNEVGGTVEMPIGMAMTMAERPDAMEAFGRLTKSEQAAVITKAKAVKSREEMTALVADLARRR